MADPGFLERGGGGGGDWRVAEGHEEVGRREGVSPSLLPTGVGLGNLALEIAHFSVF